MKKIFLTIIILLLVIIIGYSNTPLLLSANTYGYSNVLDDLSKDERFYKEDYKQGSIVDLNVIHIGESVDKELFIYTYEPNGSNKELVASSINISRDINNLKFYNYSLELLNSQDYFYKYKVINFTISDDPLRYYDISTIYTKTLTEEDIENGIVEKGFDVSQRWCVENTIDGSIKYTAKAIDTVLIRDKYVGYLEYTDGFKLYVSKCHSHYVAFSTDYDIDKLLEADVYYVSREKSRSIGAFLDGKWSYGEPEEKYVYLTSDDNVTYEGDGWFAKEYKWKRIESVKDFIDNEDLTDKTISNIQNLQWVLRFVETDYSVISGTGVSTTFATEISNVTILRLKFEVDGVTYNLGAVDNKTNDLTPDEPDNNNTNELEAPEFIKNIIKNITGFWDQFTGGAIQIFRIIGFGVIALTSIWLLSFIVPKVRKIFKKE